MTRLEEFGVCLSSNPGIHRSGLYLTDGLQKGRIMLSSELRKLEAFGLHVCREAQRHDFPLPGDIDKAAEAVTIEVGKFQAMALTTAHYVQLFLKGTASDVPRLEQLQTLFAKARDSVGVYYGANVERRQGVIDDDRLAAPDGIAEAYEALLEVVSALHNSLNALAWIIGEQIAETDRVLPGTFNTAEDLFSSMGI
ncbi:MAG TPA: hypothetical protein VN089_20440 [Duganella sp.]|nr:hypothetical protein [Duganella sp.]